MNVTRRLGKVVGAVILGAFPSVGFAADPQTPVEISVYGALSPLGLDRIGKPISSLNKEQLTKNSAGTVGDILANEPGISASSFGPGASRPVIRGQAQQRVRVLENGLESGDVSDVSDDHAIAVDPFGANRIDILRGPSTLLYGSSAIGGVVNIIDDGIPEFRAEREATGSVGIQKGSRADDENTGGGSLTGDIGPITWSASGFYRETDNMRIPGFAESQRLRAQEDAERESEHHSDEELHADEEQTKGTLENSDVLSKGFKLGASHIWNRGFVGFSYQQLDSDYGIPGHHHHHEEEDTEAEDEDHEALPRIDLNQRRIESRGRMQIDSDYFSAASFGLSYSDYEHKELEEGAIGTIFNKEAIEGRFELNHSHTDQSEGTLGTQLRYDDFNVSGDEAYLPQSTTFAPSIFSVHDYRVTQRIKAQLGGRAEYNSIEADAAGARHFGLFNFSTGASYSLTDRNDYISGTTLAYSERAPSNSELFANGAHLASQTFEIGDSNLNKERSIGAELYLRKTSGRTTGALSVFTQYYPDYIGLTPSGEESDGLPIFRYQDTRARFWGFEATGEQLILDTQGSVTLYGQLDYVRAQDTARNNPLPRITPLRGKAGIRYRLNSFSTYLEGIFVAEQDRVAEFELPTDSYSLLNIGASYELSRDSNSRYELFIRGTNLTDQEARLHSSFLKDVAPLRGRAVLAGLRLSF